MAKVKAPNKVKVDVISLQNKIIALEQAYGTWQNEIFKSGKALSNSINEKNVLKSHLEELTSIRKNMKSNALIVSLNEFKTVNDNINKILKYLEDIDSAAKHIMESLVTFTKYLKTCEKDLKVAQKELDDYGVLHEFRTNKKKNK